MRQKLGAFLGGALFGAGLAVSGMTQPAKIVGFFDFTHWDPSLAFVMVGALAVYAPVYRRVVGRWHKPIWSPSFSLPSRRDIDVRLVGGAALFGIGWGLGGYCPGPALTAVGAWSQEALVFTLAMVVGIAGFRISQSRARRPEPQAPSAPETWVDG